MKAPCGGGELELSVSEGCLSGHAESANCERVELRVRVCRFVAGEVTLGKAGALCAYRMARALF